MNFGDFQRNNRKAAGISIYRLEKLTGISRMQLSNYEELRSEPTVKNAETICNALKVTFTIGNTSLPTNEIKNTKKGGK